MAQKSATAKTLANSVYESLRADVLTCRMVPGSKIHINDLCERFNVSLHAVREALSRLSAEGLVTAQPQRGYSVTPISIREMKELTESRIEVESFCLAKSIEKGGVEWEVAIVAALHRLQTTRYRTEGDPSRLNDLWVDAHHVFHDALVSACDNEWHLRFRRHLYDQSERYRRLTLPLDRSTRDVGTEHDSIAKAALARNAGEAVKLMSNHLLRTGEILERGLEKLQLTSVS